LVVGEGIFWGCFGVAILVLLALPSAMAADYPTKAIRVVTGSAPGGGSDTVARVLAEKLSERFGQPVLVDNRAGAGGTIGADIVAKAPPDGYT
jgi:tripartite-type tricarboxylate transporter receptor subunit TctC